MTKSTMRTLQKLTDAQEALNLEVSNYYTRAILPQLKKCKTRADVLTLRNELAVQAADKQGQFRDLPFPIDMRLISASSSL